MIRKNQSIGLEIPYRTISLRIDLRSTVQAKVKDLVLGLGIFADSFRTNIAIVKLFTSLCFSRRGTPNYVYMDFKRSPSNLTLGQCKFDLMSTSRTSKLYQVAYHLTRLDGTKVLNYFVVTLVKNTITTTKTNVPYEKGICNT